MSDPNVTNQTESPSNNQPSPPNTQWMTVGRIVSPQGLDGELRVYPESEFPERFVVPGDRWLRKPKAKEPERVELLAGRYLLKKNLYVIRLKGIDYRDQAEELRQAELLVPLGDRPPLEEGEFHVLDLIGLQAINQTTGEPLGTVIDVLAAGNDLLEVALGEPPATNTAATTLSDGGQAALGKTDADKRPKVLIPFVHEIVPVVDLETQQIEVIPPPGLLDLQTTPKEKKTKNRPRGKHRKQRRTKTDAASTAPASAPDNAPQQQEAASGTNQTSAPHISSPETGSVSP